jgi:predicted membrane protein
MSEEKNDCNQTKDKECKGHKNKTWQFSFAIVLLAIFLLFTGFASFYSFFVMKVYDSLFLFFYVPFNIFFISTIIILLNDYYFKKRSISNNTNSDEDSLHQEKSINRKVKSEIEKQTSIQVVQYDQK